MRHHPKSVLAITLSVAASIWWASVQNYSSNADERIYSRQECAEDLCKISYDLAQFALYRNDTNGAIAHLKKAIDYKPSELLPYQKLSACYQELAHYEQALNVYLAARHATAGNSARRAARDRRALLQNPLPWQGENITGKKLYVDADYSLEDSICFLRFLPLLQAFKAMVFCKVPHSLLPLCNNSFPSVQFFSDGTAEHTPSCDYYVPITCLPLFLNITLKTLTPSKAYLVAEQTQVAAKKTIFSSDKIHIGLWWYNHMPKNTIPLSLLQDLAVTPNIELYALQPMHYSNANIIDLSSECHTVHETAALLANLDVMIAIDSPVAHLAGAVGTPVWLLAKHVPDDWRWSVARVENTSAWYPGMRIFQQQKAGDWLSVIADVQEALIDQHFQATGER